MPNNSALSEGSRRFIDDLSALLVPWGMPNAAGRIYAFLLESAAPASLDDIAAALGLAKSSACVSARQLERGGLARRLSVPGSKRVLYEASELFADVFAAQSALLGALGTLLRSRAPVLEGAASTARMERLAGFATAVGEAMDAVTARYVDADGEAAARRRA